MNLHKVNYSREKISISDAAHLPVEISSLCPACKEPATIDLREERVEIVLNDVYNLNFSHPIEHPCRHFWTAQIILRIGVFEANPAVYHSWIKDDDKIKIIKVLRNHTKLTLKECKVWSESGPHGIGKDLAELLEAAGAFIEWRY